MISQIRKNSHTWVARKMDQTTIIDVSTSCVCVSLILAGFLIFKHQEHFRRPSIQSKIIGIVWMVPIYSVSSLLSLLLPSNAAIYPRMLRDIYESYILYLFLALMLAYLGSENSDNVRNADDYAALKYLEMSRPADHDPSTMGSYGKMRLRYFKTGVLQYCLIRPLMTLIGIVLQFMDLYHESDFSYKYGYVYCTFVINYSACYALWVLAQFYRELGKRLKPFDPISKFLCIKFIIFFVFWQSVALAIIVRAGWLSTFGDYDKESASRAIQDFLICIEMVVVSIAFLFAFTYRPYTPEVLKLALFDKVISPIRDTYARQGRERSQEYSRVQRQLEEAQPSISVPFTGLAMKPIQYFGLEEPLRNRDKSSSNISGKGDNRKRGRGPVYSSLFLSGDDYVDGGNDDISDDRDDIVLVAMPNNSPVHPQEYESLPSRSDHLKSMNENVFTSTSPSYPQISTSSPSSSAKTLSMMNRNFSTDTVLRDFNQMLLPVLLPTNFEASKGEVIHSDSRNRMERVRALGGRKVMFDDRPNNHKLSIKESTKNTSASSMQNATQDDIEEQLTFYDTYDDGSF